MASSILSPRFFSFTKLLSSFLISTPSTMKPSSTLATLVIALATPLTTAVALPEPALQVRNNTGPEDDADAWCTWRNPGFVHEYRVYIKEVENVQATCKGLWEGIKQHRFLCPLSKKRCEPSMVYDKGLEWSFTAGLGCDVGCVQSAFWEATRNKYGALDITECQG